MMHYRYVRIQGQELAENTMYAKGIFSMCWQLVQNDTMEPEDADLFREIDAWFVDHLPFPPPCRNQEKVVCFFKTENSDEMLRMIRPALWLLEKYNHPYYHRLYLRRYHLSDGDYDRRQERQYSRYAACDPLAR